jgi:hypothetical protein
MLHYLRRHSWFSWLGLLAFASQLILTLGHVHLDREYGFTQANFAQFVRHVDAGHHAVAPTEIARRHDDTPSGPNHLGGWCAYCWTIAQAASLILAKPVKIQRERLPQTFPLPYRDAQLSSGNETSPFQSRGPPLTSKA